jgi:nitrate/nitrite transporter NarK
MLALAALTVAPEDQPDPAGIVGSVSPKVLSDPGLGRLGLLYSVAFGSTVALSNWIAELLERHGMRAEAGAIGGLILIAGVVTRPLGGWILRNQKTQIRRAVAFSLVAGCGGSALLGTSSSVLTDASSWALVAASLSRRPSPGPQACVPTLPRQQSESSMRWPPQPCSSSRHWSVSPSPSQATAGSDSPPRALRG